VAEKRMIKKSIVDSDLFLDMPVSSQNLYFHLNLRADDDGFIDNPKKIQRMVSCSEDDLKLLIAKQFLIQFDSGVIVIKHWRMHNTLRKDRYTTTMYQNEFSTLDISDNCEYKFSDDLLQCNGNVTNCNDGTNVRKISDKRPPEKEKEIYIDKEKREKTNYQQIADMYNEICISFPRLTTLSEARKKGIKARLNTYDLYDFEKMFRLAEDSDFLKGKNDRNWSGNFDWMIKDSNMAKILDGNYTNKENSFAKKEKVNPYEEILKKMEKGNITEESRYSPW
jgi:hypothetical protein